MTVLSLHDATTGARARLRPDFGFNLFDLRLPHPKDRKALPVSVLHAEPSFETDGGAPRRSGIPLLFPFPNRIRAGKFRWDGRDFQLPISDSFGNAIHGFVSDRAWRVVAQVENAIVGEFQLSVDAPDRAPLWPTDALIRVHYLLQHGMLRGEITISNPGSEPMPWGFGTHPYFRVPLAAGSSAANCLVRAPAARYWELVDCVPNGRVFNATAQRNLQEGQSLLGLHLDDVLTGLPSDQPVIETRVVDQEAGWELVQAFGPEFRELVVFTPPHGAAVCLEPYTCATDAINLEAHGIDAGWRSLLPGADARLWFELALRPVIA